jgi:chemotaxis protein methyltransferase WspC
VRLQVGNVLDPTLLASEPAFDFVFCRNLLIYFDQPTQKQVFEVLKRLTHFDGVLFIGPAEGSLLGRLGMRSIGIPQSFAFSRHSDPHPEPLPTPKPVTLPVSLPPPSTPPAVVRKRPFASVTPLSTASKGANPDAATLLANIAALANEGKSAEARAACEQYLRSHEPVAQVFYWLGLLSDVAGLTLEAQGFLSQGVVPRTATSRSVDAPGRVAAGPGRHGGCQTIAGACRPQRRTADSERKR